MPYSPPNHSNPGQAQQLGLSSEFSAYSAGSIGCSHPYSTSESRCSTIRSGSLSFHFSNQLLRQTRTELRTPIVHHYRKQSLRRTTISQVSLIQVIMQPSSDVRAPRGATGATGSLDNNVSRGDRNNWQPPGPETPCSLCTLKAPWRSWLFSVHAWQPHLGALEPSSYHSAHELPA